MTSEIESLKTNEFLRRRKLRLQQVREQSKDIAKKLRQRANSEKLRETSELDTKKQKEYFEKQEKLVKRLEVLYARGLENVGVSHRSASELRHQESIPTVDPSKKRAKEAAFQLRKKKQEQLDEQKRLLDRKLRAREVANEISREKSSAVVNKLITKPSVGKDNTQSQEDLVSDHVTTKGNECQVDQSKIGSQPVAMADMATQWDFESHPNEWEPEIPTLPLSKDDKDSVKESESNVVNSKSDKSKKLDLFALSKDMPSSLRGENVNIPESRVPIKPALTIVSEYLKNRELRLREFETASSMKKTSEDLHNIKQIIQQSRISRPEVSGKSSNNMEKSRSDSQDNTLNRKNSVTIYNHATRNTRDIVYNDPKLVVRDLQTEEDAYSQAMKETSADNIRDKDPKAFPDTKNKIAMMKQNVEKEYKNTMNFLKSAPKDKYNKTMRSAYMDDRRQQMVKDSRQHILQQEYKKIEKECRKHQYCNKSLTKSKSPKKVSIDDIESRDFQYSWMPVPESDGNLAIHTIPTTLKEGKSGNTVKFSEIDSYHEYRSRHKHTPPTKDTTPEMDIIDKSSSDSMDSSSISTDASSIENLELKHNKRKTKHKHKEQNMSDAERIIIYKILETKSDKKSKKNRKLISDIAKSLTSIERANNNDIEEEKKNKSKSISKESDNRVSVEEVNEGVYKMVNEKGKNITSMYFSDNQLENDKGLHSDGKSQQADSCSRDNPNQEQKNSGNNLNWECSDNAARTANLTAKRKDSLVTQPSATTSATSFKTVMNDKPSVESGDNFIKLVDDTGQEAGKFYIGATGFLRDESYEMVIQLRKKGGKHEDIKNASQFKHTDKTNENGNVQPKNDIIDIKASDAEVHDILLESNALYKVPPQSFSEAVPDANAEPINTTTIQNLEQQDINKDEIHKTNFVDKAVCTSFNLSYAVPANIPKTDPVTVPATSTCTQTTLNSPNHRPVLYHMSSSTSTAYMSPPEMVLPKFLKQDFYTSDYDMVYEPIKKVEITQKHINDSHNTDCKNCPYDNSGMYVNTPGFYKKCEYGRRITNTPPNTARICTSHHRRERKTKTMVTSPADKNTNFTCQTCENRLRYKIHTSAETQKFKHNVLGKNGTNGINSRGKTSVLPRNKDKTSLGKKTGTSNLNPIIKQYVNRLLDLNKEGLQVIEVVEQECSSVTTPGSSVINVPYNVDERKLSVEKKISLEQIKNILKEQIILEHKLKMEDKTKDASAYSTSSIKNIIKPFILRKRRLKPVHKIKSLNISKHLLKSKSSEKIKQVSKKPVSTSTTDNNVNALQKSTLRKTKSRTRSKSSPTPKHVYNSESVSKFTDSQVTDSNKIRIEKVNTKSKPTSAINKRSSQYNNINYTFKSHRATITSTSPDSESTGMSQLYKPEIPINMSTQTSQNVDSEASFMKLAEDKLHNMEKIADLTEKCTQRLSNLAKVLEEVRKNKSLVYSQISTSDSTSDSDQKSDKAFIMPSSSDTNIQISNEKIKNSESISHIDEGTGIEKAKDQQIEYTQFLTDIPKPATLKVPNTNSLQTSKSLEKLNIAPELNMTPESTSKFRPKPPPAMSRIYLKHGQDFVVPHELSTVLEVDSPMSVKQKSQSSRNNNKNGIPDSISQSPNDSDENQKQRDDVDILKDTNVNPDLLQSNKDKQQSILKSPTESFDNSKLQMIDLKHFNQIMLEPFISIQEYAKQYNVVALDEGSNIEDVQKEDIANDDISSLHSDGSLPDVVAELLKRNIITEPFKFDSPSNANSSTISSESTISMLALSKVRKAKKQSNVIFQNKENIAESSDSLSISSNPDLENAFKKLGMGWASSTLKKTKERLALSSSSNTSSSSVSQFKIKKLNPDIPALITDSVSSVLNSSKIGLSNPTSEHPRNVVQQTSLINSMTVKEFLANELANKITFTNKSNRSETGEDFVSLLETKMPEEMKEDHSVGSRHTPSGANNRARTSTPVQIFKSMTYHSSSSSNVSNGLFSNADDLSSVKMTSNSLKNHSTSDKDDLTVPNLSLRLKKGSDYSKSD